MKDKRRRIDPESYEMARDPHYPSWKSDAQLERLKADIESLQREEKDARAQIKEESGKHTDIPMYPNHYSSEYWERMKAEWERVKADFDSRTHEE